MRADTNHFKIWLCFINIVVSKKEKYRHIPRHKTRYKLALLNQLEWFIFDSCLHRLHIPGHRMSLSLCSAGLQLHHQNYPEKYCVKHYLGTFAFPIRKNHLKRYPHYCQLFLLLTLICVKKISSSYECMFLIFQLTSKRCWKRHRILYWN